MKKSLYHSLIVVSLIAILIVTFTACYGSWNFFYEGNSVDERTKGMKYLSDAGDSRFAASGISSLNGKYTVLVVTDTHFGNTRKARI